MTNEVLRQAITEAGETYESLAAVADVDPKTAARWVYQGRVPHPRARAAVAAKLKREISELWPERRRSPSWLRPWIEIEREATALRSFQPLMIPGLLQTHAYAREALLAGHFDVDRVHGLVVGRVQRQRVLHVKHPPDCTLSVFHRE